MQVQSTMQNLNETETVQALMRDEACLGDALFFAISNSLAISEEPQECTIHIATEILRQNLGLEIGRKPGDIDMLIIPEINGNIYFEKSISIEVKVVRPTLAKPEKNANKMGATQANGLSEDGFPYVGLLHLKVTENSPDSNKLEMPNGYMMDFFPLEASLRQKGRLRGLELLPHIGFSSTGLLSRGSEFIGSSFGVDKHSTINPKLDKLLVKSIEAYFNAERKSFKTFETYG